MRNKESRFAACHPALTFAFYMVAIVEGVIFQHPVYLLVSSLSAVCLLLTEKGRKALPMIFGMLPLFLLLSAVNPLFNTYGERVLFAVFGRPYTLEALLYGMVISGILITAILWFSCYNAVMTSDKFTCLFGSVIPSLSLVLVMILRLIPSYQRKATQISGARKCVGKASSSTEKWSEKAQGGLTILSSLTSWALEGAIITADSMRSRGYGTAKRSSYQIYRLTSTDIALLAVIGILFVLTIVSACLGWTSAAFTPVLEIAPVSGWASIGIIAYAVMLLLPTAINLSEELKWKYLESKI